MELIILSISPVDVLLNFILEKRSALTTSYHGCEGPKFCMYIMKQYLIWDIR
jgi:hypothetical protein